MFRYNTLAVSEFSIENFEGAGLYTNNNSRCAAACPNGQYAIDVDGGNFQKLVTSCLSGCACKPGRNLNCWNTSSVTDMHKAFYGHTSYNEPLECWDTSSVTIMWSMFEGASTFNQPINSWDTASVKDFASIFNTAFAFNQPIDLWDTSSVYNMGHMFNKAHAFNQPIDSWDTSLVQYVDNIFHLFSTSPLMHGILQV